MAAAANAGDVLVTHVDGGGSYAKGEGGQGVEEGGDLYFD